MTLPAPPTPRLAFRQMAGFVRDYRLCGFKESEKAGLSLLRCYREQHREMVRFTRHSKTQLKETTMQIDLTKTESEVIEQALDSWEKESHSQALQSMMLGAMFSKKDDGSKKEFEDETKREMDKATNESNRRKRLAVMLRAKLYSAQTASAVSDAFAVKEQA